MNNADLLDIVRTAKQDEVSELAAQIGREPEMLAREIACLWWAFGSEKRAQFVTAEAARKAQSAKDEAEAAAVRAAKHDLAYIHRNEFNWTPDYTSDEYQNLLESIRQHDGLKPRFELKPARAPKISSAICTPTFSDGR